jgi:hypothetical protein
MVGKELADVAGRGGAQHGIDQSMGNGVRVGVALQASFMRNGDATQHQRTTLHETMRVVADAYPDHAATFAGSSMIE